MAVGTFHKSRSANGGVPRGVSPNGSIQNGPRRLKQIKALHWQTPARGSFDHQRLFGALANRITLKTPMVLARKATNGGNGQR